MKSMCVVILSITLSLGIADVDNATLPGWQNLECEVHSISMKEMNYSNVTARIILQSLFKSWTSMFRITSRHLSTGFVHLLICFNLSCLWSI